MATVDASGRLVFAPGEKEAYQDKLKTDLNLPADFVFGGGNFSNLLATDPVRANLAQNIRQDFVNNPYGISTQTQVSTSPAPAAPPPPTAQAIAAEVDLPEIDYNRISGLMAPTQTAAQGAQTAAQAAQTGIGTAAVGQPATLFGGQAGLATGQEGILQGQAGLATGQAGLATGQADLTSGQQQLGVGQAGLMAGQQVLGEGQQTIGQGVGRGLDLMGTPMEEQPQTLFGGQAGLMQGQQQIGGGVESVGRDIGSLSGNLSDFQRAVQAYQQRARGEREQAVQTGISGRQNLGQQVGDVGQQLRGQVRDVGLQANRVAEQQATMARVPQQQAAQAGQIATTMGRNFGRAAPQQQSLMGPSGPVAVDPRDMVRFGPTGSPV